MPPVAHSEAETATRCAWVLPPPASAEDLILAAAVGLPPALAPVLARRGIHNEAAARTFLHPQLEHLHDPLRMAGMRSAAERIIAAVQQREPILIYGDYDVDGTLATVLLKTAIDRITPKGSPSLVRYHIPHRIREGYGVQPAVLGEAAKNGVRLVVSVDTGIRAFAAADEARALGLDLIVTDHHLPEELGLPDALAVVNPNQPGCDYPYKELCGAAVAFKLADALLSHVHRNQADGLQPVEAASLGKLRVSLLKLAAIATVADAVPLDGENRTIVSLGLAELRNVRQPGLRALMRLAKVGEKGDAPTATEIAFRIGPRINAAGRMDVASDVVRLLLTRDADEATTLAEGLHQRNEERRGVEKEVLLQIEAHLAPVLAASEDARPACFVLDGKGWHRGVVGILASRVVEKMHRPALVITHEGDVAHGSGRSIAGFHLLDGITAAQSEHEADFGTPLFDRFGGHAHAVGFALPSANVPALRTYLTEHAAATLTPAMLVRTLRADAELPLAQITPAFLAALKRMQPFGAGNTEPVFLCRGATIQEFRVLKDKHLKLRLSAGDAQTTSCLCWSRAVPWPERLAALGIGAGSIVDLLFQLQENDHPDFGGPELHLCDVRQSGTGTTLA